MPSLEEIASMVEDCKKCKLWKYRQHAVPGEGPSNASIVIIGRNPGVEEDRQGRPFVGRAGKFLEKLLGLAGIERKHAFITNPVKCFTPRNREPEPDEVKACTPFLYQQLDALKPKLIVALGNLALKVLTGKEGVGKHRGRVLIYKHSKVFCTYHPSAALRFPAIEQKVVEDFKQLGRLIQSLKDAA